MFISNIFSLIITPICCFLITSMDLEWRKSKRYIYKMSSLYQLEYILPMVGWIICQLV